MQESLVLVHGGMAQNVGPVLEMVTEKFLLRCETEWQARQEALRVFDGLLAALAAGDLQAIGRLTHRNFHGPIQAIIPWASNFYTETLIRRTADHFGGDFWGFWMLGGMSGGGMGFLFAASRKGEAQDFLQQTMSALRKELQHSLPFAMEPVVYDFAVNERGTYAELCAGDEALMPSAYYALQAPVWLRRDPRQLSPLRRQELERFGIACRHRPEMAGMIEVLVDRLLPREGRTQSDAAGLRRLLEENGFDREQHEQIRADLKRGLIGLAQNRFRPNRTIADVAAEDVLDTTQGISQRERSLGEEALAEGAVAVVTLAAGAGSRWTQGAGVVKAIHPFCKFGGRHRTFLEVHLAKSRRACPSTAPALPHLVTTGYLTHEPIADHLRSRANYGYPGPLLLSPGQAVGLRLVPMVRDLRFAWEELPQQMLDEQAQKVRDSLHAALIQWARQAGEGNDYTDNLPLQCLHPVGHWFEVANLLRNGTLQRLLEQRPALRYLMLHNIDTLGADVDPGLLGLHIAGGRCLTFEVVPRRIDDRGGGLARVDGRVQLVESLALPREEDEFKLSYYNSLTTWIDIDRLLAVFGLTRADLVDAAKVAASIRRLAARIPTYITLKEVKKRWGHGQEDVYPVCQFEKLWGDMTTLPEVECSFAVVPRPRGQQLKDQAQLDGWVGDGSATYVEALCRWQ